MAVTDGVRGDRARPVDVWAVAGGTVAVTGNVGDVGAVVVSARDVTDAGATGEAREMGATKALDRKEGEFEIDAEGGGASRALWWCGTAHGGSSEPGSCGRVEPSGCGALCVILGMPGRLWRRFWWCRLGRCVSVDVSGMTLEPADVAGGEARSLGHASADSAVVVVWCLAGQHAASRFLCACAVSTTTKGESVQYPCSRTCGVSLKGSEMAGRMLCRACESTMRHVGRPGGSIPGGGGARAGGRRDQTGRGGKGGDKRGGKTWGTAADGDCAAVDGPGDGSDGVSEAATGDAVLRVTGNVTGRVAEARGLCGLLPIDMAIDRANGAEPNEGRTTCPSGQDGRGTHESDPDKRDW